jgi:two-component sensor histidine kinase
MGSIRLLLIEDNPGDARLIREILTERGGLSSIKVEWRENLKEGLERLRQGSLDILLLDLALPDSSGFETFDMARQADPRLAIIVLTGTTDEELGLKTVSSGAQDYLVKGQYESNLLVRSIRYAIERKQGEEKLKTAIREKEVLIKEVHHRVKNNLQMINSLLALQSQRVKSGKAAGLLRESQNRIRSIALMHERLYRSPDLANINLAEYLQLLTGNLFYSFGADPEKINLTVEVGNVHLDIDSALPCGLIINELVSNALRHAFPNNRPGTLHIEMRSENDDKIMLMVSDNGVGIPHNFDVLKTESLGLQLVQALSGQLGGNLEINKEQGTHFILTFPRVRLLKD